MIAALGLYRQIPKLKWLGLKGKNKKKNKLTSLLPTDLHTSALRSKNMQKDIWGNVMHGINAMCIKWSCKALIEKNIHVKVCFFAMFSQELATPIMHHSNPTEGMFAITLSIQWELLVRSTRTSNLSKVIVKIISFFFFFSFLNLSLSSPSLLNTNTVYKIDWRWKCVQDRKENHQHKLEYSVADFCLPPPFSGK